MAMKMTLDEYLGQRGLSFPVSDFMIDKVKLPHGQTARQRKQLEREAMHAAQKYAEQRRIAIEEYNALVENGEIVPKTTLEQTIERATYGHLDNPSTQAALRICQKRGITIQRANG